MNDSLRTCVAPEGHFLSVVHRPKYATRNLRQSTLIESLGPFDNGQPKRNDANFPDGDVEESNGEWIYEIPNAFPFLGTTYILKSWADASARSPDAFVIPGKSPLSFTDFVRTHLLGSDADEQRVAEVFRQLPEALQLTLAVNSTDPADLIQLAEISCTLVRNDGNGQPIGLAHVREKGENAKAVIANHLLFEAVANNPYLPDEYKNVMVLKPGIQGSSEIVGEWKKNDSHVFEYLRRNSYIPWGHYAANMANDAVRYRIGDLTPGDMYGMRHLYYQRTYIRLAEALDIELPASRRALTPAELEALRQKIADDLHHQKSGARLPFLSTLWGWNFGFDFSPSGYRLHASHQQIHTQYALIPKNGSVQRAPGVESQSVSAYGCGELVAEFIQRYREKTGRSFFPALIAALKNNRRFDGGGDNQSLIIYEDEQVMLYVPKAQTSQWELQLITLKPVGNILEADTATRRSLDRGILAAMQTLERMGATMITVIEYAKRFVTGDADQRLLYVFLPRLPQSPGAFSEAQRRWISGHYPEDFAAACRNHLPSVDDPDSGATDHP